MHFDFAGSVKIEIAPGEKHPGAAEFNQALTMTG
jgi:hypothetical protein